MQPPIDPGRSFQSYLCKGALGGCQQLSVKPEHPEAALERVMVQSHQTENNNTKTVH